LDTPWRGAASELDPSSSGWRRDLSVSYNKLGVVLAKQDQRDEALALFGEKARYSRMPDEPGSR
jgi:hypothetical protein